MGQVRIYHDEDDREYTVNFDLKNSLLADGNGNADFYLVIKTSLKTVAGASFGEWRVKTLADIPPGGTIATDFNDLCNQYIDYFMAGAELAQSSSSSSSDSSESTQSSESSSSVGHSSSSSLNYSESSSSAQYSESSSSS